jgi:hypothetical protein
MSGALQVNNSNAEVIENQQDDTEGNADIFEMDQQNQSDDSDDNTIYDASLNDGVAMVFTLNE